jgi:hypothetical protein
MASSGVGGVEGRRRREDEDDGPADDVEATGEAMSIDGGELMHSRGPVGDVTRKGWSAAMKRCSEPFDAKGPGCGEDGGDEEEKARCTIRRDCLVRVTRA